MMRTCEFCQSHTESRILGSHAIRFCLNCLGYSYDGALPTRLEDLYNVDYFSGKEYFSYQLHEPVHRRNFLKKWKILRPYLPSRPRIFEVGCAYGYFCDIALNHGAEAYHGVDVSRDAIESAIASYGKNFSCQYDVPHALPSGTNVIVAWDVLEHMKAPREYFSYLVEKLPQNGVLAITTVDSYAWVARARRGRWRQLHPPTHLHYPSKESLRRLLTRLGLRIVYHRSIGISRALETYAAACGISSLKFLGRLRLVPLGLNLGDIQFVIALK